MLVFLLFVFAFVQGTIGQNSCSYQSQNFNINWNIDFNNNVNFNLSYINFPTNGNYWLAFGYSQNNLILIESLNGQVGISTANIVGNQPRKTVGSNVLQSQSAFLSNNNLQAQFVIPLAALRAASNSGTGCMTWTFYSIPTQNGANFNGSPQTQQVCNIEQTCNTDGTSNSFGQGFASTQMPNQNYQNQAMYNQNSQFQMNNQFNQQSTYQTNPNSQFSNQFSSSNQQNVQYDPSNPNVQYYPYTFNQGFSGNYDGNQLSPQYDAPAQTNVNGPFIAQNPNYQFLSPQLNQIFRDNEFKNSNQNGLLRDQNGNFPTTTTEPPILSNDQQNRLNYQRIQQNPPTMVNPSLYTNNIYGYDYRSNPNMQYTVNGNPQQYQPPSVRKFQPPQNSPFARRKRQAVSPSATSASSSGSLDNTAYAGQDRQFIRNDNYGTFFDSSVNPRFNTTSSAQNFNRQSTAYYYGNQRFNTPTNYNPNVNNNNNYNYDYNRANSNHGLQFDQTMYYPYLTPVVNPNSPNFQQVQQQDAAALNDYTDPNCTGNDPYWCQNYVQNFMLWQNQYDNSVSQPNQAQSAQQPSNAACSALADSLKNSYHRCCQTVRSIGCQ